MRTLTTCLSCALLTLLAGCADAPVLPADESFEVTFDFCRMVDGSIDQEILGCAEVVAEGDLTDGDLAIPVPLNSTGITVVLALPLDAVGEATVVLTAAGSSHESRFVGPHSMHEGAHEEVSLDPGSRTYRFRLDVCLIEEATISSTWFGAYDQIDARIAVHDPGYRVQDSDQPHQPTCGESWQGAPLDVLP